MIYRKSSLIVCILCFVLIAIISICAWSEEQPAKPEAKPKTLNSSSFQLGVWYALQAIEDLWGAKEKFGLARITNDRYISIVFGVAQDLAKRDNFVLQIATDDEEKN